jgi:toxin ParE1/3/4
MTLRFTPRAGEDLRKIMEYIARENPEAADRVGRAILDTAALVAARPHLGIRNARAAQLRSRLVSRYPYRIHYFVQGADVWIVHIRHSARRPLGQD